MRPSERMRRYQELEAEGRLAAASGDVDAMKRISREMTELEDPVDPSAGVVYSDDERKLDEAKATAGRTMVRIVCAKCGRRQIAEVVHSRHGPLFRSTVPAPVLVDDQTKMMLETHTAVYPTWGVAVLLSTGGQLQAHCDKHGPRPLDADTIADAVRQAANRKRPWDIRV